MTGFTGAAVAAFREKIERERSVVQNRFALTFRHSPNSVSLYRGEWWVTSEELVFKFQDEKFLMLAECSVCRHLFLVPVSDLSDVGEIVSGYKIYQHECHPMWIDNLRPTVPAELLSGKKLPLISPPPVDEESEDRPKSRRRRRVQ